MKRLSANLIACLAGVTMSIFLPYVEPAFADVALGLPAYEIDKSAADDPIIALGKKLFFDKRLSVGGTISCASCHIPEKAFSDGLPVAQGVGGRLGSRNTPSLLNVRYESSLFWDGRRATLEQQAADPLSNPREHGLENIDAALAVLAKDSKYPVLFKRAFSDRSSPVSSEELVKAIAAYERTLAAADSPFDRYFYAKESGALSVSAIRGMDLFMGRARCVTCHLVGQSQALFSDGEFHYIGIGFARIEKQLTESALRVANADARQLDLMIIEDRDIAELGRFLVTKQPHDIAKFKTPSLRNVALTAPYMHDGSIATLAEAVDSEIYYRSLDLNRPLILTAQEKFDLIAFLRSLTSPQALSSH